MALGMEPRTSVRGYHLSSLRDFLVTVPSGPPSNRSFGTSERLSGSHLRSSSPSTLALISIDLLVVLLCLIAAAIDLRFREIPDSIWILIVALMPLRIWWLWPDVPTWHCVVGAVVALAIGGLVAGEDRFGGGDVKLFAALGGWFGIFAVVPLAMWCAIAGLVLAIVAAMRKQNDYAYGPAITIGVIVHWLVPDLLGRIGGWV